MNYVFFSFAFLIGSERGFEASVFFFFFFFFFHGGNVTIREGEGGDGRNRLCHCFFVFFFFFFLSYLKFKIFLNDLFYISNPFLFELYK